MGINWKEIVMCLFGFFRNAFYSYYLYTLGDLLIVMAQIMYAIQAVYEQNILTKYSNLSPFECLGYEGKCFLHGAAYVDLS